ncbi:MAG: shikimate dehydrogenase [Peptococcia bacterium]|jgi:shikimate dehydrogenase
MCSIPVDGTTPVFAVLGNPIGHSLSPAMYNAAFRALRMNSIYVALPADHQRPADVVKGIRALGLRGGNVTIPLKEAIVPYLDGITEEARLIGAVNTFYWEKGTKALWGDNTDGAGFLAAIRKVRPQVLRERSALLLGAGGAARAVAVSLALTGLKELTIINRNLEKAAALAGQVEKLGMKVQILSWPQGEEQDFKELFRECALIVNTTPLGMSPHEEAYPPIKEAWLHSGQLVVDLIYRPRETAFLRKAKAAGCLTLNGLSMLLEQGVLSFQRWAGKPAPVEIMARELERWV